MGPDLEPTAGTGFGPPWPELKTAVAGFGDTSLTLPQCTAFVKGCLVQQTVRALSSEIRDVFGRWLTAQCAAGVRFVVLEGLMRSCKSYLTEQPFALGTGQSLNIELDDFLRRPVNHDTEYMHAIDVDAAIANIMEAYRTGPLVIAEGPMAWPVVRGIEISCDEVRRVYLKRMSSNYPDLWHDGDFLYEVEPPSVYCRSINRYHATERPWLLAELVCERIGRDDE
jgi:hypothetical protein